MIPRESYLENHIWRMARIPRIELISRLMQAGNTTCPFHRHEPGPATMLRKSSTGGTKSYLLKVYC